MAFTNFSIRKEDEQLIRDIKRILKSKHVIFSGYIVEAIKEKAKRDRLLENDSAIY